MKKLFFLPLFITAVTVLNAQQVVQINKKTNSPNEPSIFINPKNPAQVIAGSNIDNLYVSSDTGKTWSESKLKSPLGVYGDPVVYADGLGNFYFCHLSKTADKSFPEWIDRIIVQKSTDGGNTFNDGVGVGYNGNKAQDKHWIIADNTGGPNNGNLYLSWTEFDKYGSKSDKDHSRIMFARSTDGGMSFSKPAVISDIEGDCIDGDNTTEGAVPAVGADGTVYVAWSLSGVIYLDKSTDGGKTFGKDKAIVGQQGGWDIPISQVFRANGMPFLISDYISDNHKGNLYLIWGDLSNGDADVFVSSSRDNGDTWGKPIRVNDDEVANGKDQFFCHLAVDPVDGMLYAVFYDRRNSENNLFTDVYVAYSDDGGLNWVNKKITNRPFTPPGKMTFFGDYNNIAAYDGIVRPIWTETTEDFAENPMGNLIKGTDLIINTAILNKHILLNDDLDADDDQFYFNLFFNSKTDKLYIYYQVEAEKYDDVKLMLIGKSKEGKKVKLNKKNFIDKKAKGIVRGEVSFDLSGKSLNLVTVKMSGGSKTTTKKAKTAI